MPNFAQECPFLLFVPFFILAGLAAIVGFVHLVLRVAPGFKRWRTTAKRHLAIPAFVTLSFEPFRNRPRTERSKPRLVSRKV